jgi:hypothetical protein
MTAYVGIDLHRRRSLAVCLDEEGERLWWRRFENSPLTMAEVVAEAGPDPEVVLEATWGWYWAADVIAEAGGRVRCHQEPVRAGRIALNSTRPTPPTTVMFRSFSTIQNNVVF